MTRDELIASAMHDIDQADDRGSDQYRISHYLGAIAKVLVVNAMGDAGAPRGTPRITEASEWLPMDPI